MLLNSTWWWKMLLKSAFYSCLNGLDHRGARKQTLLHQLSYKVLDQFGRKWICCWDLLVWWTHAINIVEREPHWADFVRKTTTTQTVVCVWRYRQISFNLGMVIWHGWTVQFATSLNDLNFSFTVVEESKNFCTHFRVHFSVNLD